ncbi:MAG TPA: energy transducer TonB [Myxococcaceae bacterium]|jgi:protein TonB
MFDSVLDRGVAPRRRLATGAVISVLGHAAVLSGLLLIRPPATVVEEPPKVITWPVVLPMFTAAPAPGPVGGGGARAHAGPPRAQKRRELLAPAVVPKPPPDIKTVAPPDETPPPIGGRIGPPDNTPDPKGPGDGEGGGGGGPPGSGGTCVGGACDFETGMTRPILIERGRDPAFTPEALEAHVEGVMTVQCVVTLAGRLEQCQVIRPLPYMERSVVDALRTRRYDPATLNGRPLAVRYVFHIKLVMPR